MQPVKDLPTPKPKSVLLTLYMPNPSRQFHAYQQTSVTAPVAFNRGTFTDKQVQNQAQRDPVENFFHLLLYFTTNFSVSST